MTLMSEPTGRSFEHEALEADLMRLAEAVKQHRERPEMKGEPDEAMIKEALKEAAEIHKEGGGAAPNTTPGGLPPYLQGASDEAKLEVEYLLDQVFHKGLYGALKEARGVSAFVEDAFHDALVEALLPELKRRKLL
jgi:hypothetical protein